MANNNKDADKAEKEVVTTPNTPKAPNAPMAPEGTEVKLDNDPLEENTTDTSEEANTISEDISEEEAAALRKQQEELIEENAKAEAEEVAERQRLQDERQKAYEEEMERRTNLKGFSTNPAVKESAQALRNDKAPSNWLILPLEDGNVEASNSATGSLFRGARKELSAYFKS